mmetsp:Transcript_16529/g.53130  ORF Transcript_16529/g.53130 Transcript_16529/m.53130 type:complete len:145 (+) Transcript_16529:211-645(+)
MQYAVPMRQMHLIHRRMPDDVDVGVTRSEQAVEMLERSGCRGACFGAEALCIEPVSTKSQMDWAFVGEGRGGYNQVQAYNFVGENTGSYNKSESVTMTGWTMKPIGIGLRATIGCEQCGVRLRLRHGPSGLLEHRPKNLVLSAL